MTRREMLVAAVLRSLVAGSFAMIGLTDHGAAFAEDDGAEAPWLSC